MALGSNLGDREGNLRRAIMAIGARTRLVAASSVYETEPMYREDQGWFLNCVVVVETDLDPHALLRWLKETEAELGRDPRAARNAPRVIDMDILFYGEVVISGPSLQLPHPGIAERAFVLVPLEEVRPSLVHPVLGKSVAELLDGLQTRKGVVRRPDVLSGLLPLPPRQP
ncbi:MAG: 2-amino-4-hydroxy-6-hydroxymethyldihydropteridine diphosphokinase [Thaumarchaeota archaeon]|nr:2-amino-4-hydroxy-6-hydroxymethyldihydropteridine diphosphokinase [Nitrososphaerota archaeon]